MPTKTKKINFNIIIDGKNIFEPKYKKLQESFYYYLIGPKGQKQEFAKSEALLILRYLKFLHETHSKIPDELSYECFTKKNFFTNPNLDGKTKQDLKVSWAYLHIIYLINQHGAGPENAQKIIRDLRTGKENILKFRTLLSNKNIDELSQFIQEQLAQSQGLLAIAFENYKNHEKAKKQRFSFRHPIDSIKYIFTKIVDFIKSIFKYIGDKWTQLTTKTKPEPIVTVVSRPVSPERTLKSALKKSGEPVKAEKHVVFRQEANSVRQIPEDPEAPLVDPSLRAKRSNPVSRSK